LIQNFKTKNQRNKKIEDKKLEHKKVRKEKVKVELGKLLSPCGQTIQDATYTIEQMFLVWAKQTDS